MKRLFIFVLLIVAADLSASQICSSTSTYSPIAGVTHQTAVLTDPAGEQTAMFDLAWGGALISLKYHDVEYINSASTLAGIQPMLRATNYMAVLAGDDENRGSPMLGVACSDRELWLTSGMTDYNRNQGASTAYVHNNSQWYFDHFSAPYVVSTYAYFVPNPFGSPAYYLMLNQSISNIDGQESVAFTLDLTAAPAAPYGFFRSLPTACSGSSSSCTATTAYMVGGYYNAAGTDGLAIAMTPSAQWTGEAGTVSVEGDAGTAGNVIHLKKNGWHAGPRTGRTHSSVVMVGGWASASGYASQACTFAVSLPFVVPTPLYSSGEGGDSSLNGTIPASGATTTVAVTAPPGCSWSALVEGGSAPNYLSVTPSTGSGDGSVTLNIATNPTSAIRIGRVFIAGQLFPFWQQIGCLYSLDSSGANVPAGGGNGAVNVTAPAGSCSWRATTDAAWITITSGSSGNGNGAVNYSAAANSGSARSASMIVAGLNYTVSQAAAPNSPFDPNGDGVVSSSDIFYLVNYLFLSGPLPRGPGGLLSGDANHDGHVTSSDIFFVVNFLFLGGPAPSIPTEAIPGGESAPSNGNDRVTVGTVTAAGNTVDVPVYIRDVKGTPLGRDLPRGSRIQSFGIKVAYSPASSVSSVTFTRSGITASLSPTVEFNPSTANTISLIDTFQESSNLIPLTSWDPKSGSPAPGNLVAHLVFTLSGSAPPGSSIAITLDPSVTLLSDEGGNTSESPANGTLGLVDGAINIPLQIVAAPIASMAQAPAETVPSSINSGQSLRPALFLNNARLTPRSTSLLGR